MEAAPGASQPAESGERGCGGWEGRVTGQDRSRARRCRLLFRPEVGVCPAAFCAGSSRLPSCAATAAEGQEQEPREEAARGTREREGGGRARESPPAGCCCLPLPGEP